MQTSALDHVVYIDALQQLLDGAFLAAIALVLIALLWRVWRWHRRHPETDAPVVLAFGLAMTILLALIAAIVLLGNLWNWIAVLGDPQLAWLHQQLIAHRAAHFRW